MRISTQKNDPGYDPEIHLKETIEIFVDGKKIETVHTADTDLGVVFYYVKNAKGRIETKSIEGEVEIRGL